MYNFALPSASLSTVQSVDIAVDKASIQVQVRLKGMWITLGKVQIAIGCVI